MSLDYLTMSEITLDEPEEVSSLFSDTTLAPSNLLQVRSLVTEFCEKHHSEKRPVVLITVSTDQSAAKIFYFFFQSIWL